MKYIVDPFSEKTSLNTPYSLLRHYAEKWPDKEALVFDAGNQRMTFRGWLDSVDKLALELSRRGVKAGDPVALLAENRIEWPVAQIAISALGAILVPVNTHFRDNDLRHVLDHSQVVTILLSERFRSSEYLAMVRAIHPQLPSLRDIINFDDMEYEAVMRQPVLAELTEWVWSPRELASIQYTSGTTGRPKGAELCMEGIMMNAWGTVQRLEVTAMDRWTSIIPLFHCAGCIMNILACLTAGATYLGMRAFDAGQMLSLIERERCTVLTGVPTSYLAMLEHPDRPYFDLSSLRTGTCGGADCDPRLLEQCARAFPINGLVQVYGQTEASTLIALDYWQSPQRFATAGLPLPGVEVQVCDPNTGVVLPHGEIGQLQVRGPMVMLGYHRDAEETARCIDPQGWMNTGDLGRLNIDGRVELVGGRLRDMIIRGGENIYPVEIENLLREHPSITEVAVFALPDKFYGEVVAAAIESTKPLSKDEIRKACVGKIAGFKHPARVFTIVEWPMTSSGKILKRMLKSAALDGQLKELL